MRSLLAATAFLTRFPVRTSVAFDAADVGHSAGWFPFVGILLGGFYCGAAAVLKYHLPLGVVAVVLVLLDALLTGALHYDGLADSADGFGGGKSREDILRIMREHAIGSYGGVALVLAVALKVAAYDALLGKTHWIPALILTPALGRWSILLLTGTLTYARANVTSTPSCRASSAGERDDESEPELRQSPAVEGMGKRALVFGTLLMVVALGAAQSGRAWIAAAVVVAVTAGFGQYCQRRIGGITGDTLGASVQISESAALLTFLWIGFSQ